MVRLTWTIQAANDLEHIYEYISRDSVKYARIQIERIQYRVKLLKRHPKTGRVISEIEAKLVREILVGRYRIIYRFKSEKSIEILAVHHPAKLLRLD